MLIFHAYPSLCICLCARARIIFQATHAHLMHSPSLAHTRFMIIITTIIWFKSRSCTQPKKEREREAESICLVLINITDHMFGTYI